MNLSNNFTVKEMYYSDTAIKKGIDNSNFDAKVLSNAKMLAEEVLQPLRDFINEPIIITSWYRSDLLNAAVGGSKTSAHRGGYAADFKCSDMNKAFEFIRNNLKFDQLIWEYGNDESPDWIHVSYIGESNNRNQVLRIDKGGKYYRI